MKNLPVKSTIIDEANGITYVISAKRALTDGEAYHAIRVALIARGRKLPGKGETLEIAWQR